MAKTKRKKKYRVGYKSPPKKTRFKKGVSGNPKGRPRKPKMEPKRVKPIDQVWERISELTRELFTLREQFRDLHSRHLGLSAAVRSGSRAILIALNEFTPS